MKETILIIGGGISGLTSAFYALKNGFNIKLFERNKNLGGYCASWQRKKFTLSAGIHAIVGIKDGEQYNDLWNELGIMKNMEFKANEIFQEFEVFDKDKSKYEKIEIDSDLNKLEDSLLRYSPEDKKIICEITRTAKILSKADIILENEPRLSSFVKKIGNAIKLIPYLPILLKWKNIKVKTISQKFKNPVLKQAFLKIWAPNFSFLFVLVLLSYASKKNIGFPMGGVDKIIEIITGNLNKMGCEIHLNSEVTGYSIRAR